MSTDDKRTKLVEDYIDRSLHAAVVATKLWSFAHHGTMFGAAAFSAAAALVLQLKTLPLDPTVSRDLATFLAAVASFVGVISVSGAFGAKWRANRATRGTLHELQLEMMKETPNLDAIVEQLQAMWHLHNSRISDEPDHPKTAVPEALLSPAKAR